MVTTATEQLGGMAMNTSNGTWTVLEALVKRFLNEEKRVFVYKVGFGDIQLDIDGETAEKICNCIPQGQFSEKLMHKSTYGEIDYTVDCIMVKYDGNTYLIQNKLKEIYSNFYLYFQITPMDVINIS